MAASSSSRPLEFLGGIKRSSLLVALYLVLLVDAVVGGRIESMRRDARLLDRTRITRFKSEDGDIIDCVNIYKQPAFDHPMLKNHTIQMEPRIYLDDEPEKKSTISGSLPIEQLWQRSGSCPQGTIPIRRTSEQDQFRSSSSNIYIGITAADGRIESAEARSVVKPYHGANATMNVWKLNVEPYEFSFTHLKIMNDRRTNLVQTGLGAYPALFGDDKTRLYAYWQGDGTDEGGCYNLQCPGFIQVTSKVALGGTIWPLSTYGGEQYDMDTAILKDKDNKKWWLFIQGEPIGYWPVTLFSDLDVGKQLSWGGSVYSTHVGGPHTTTQMGSGHPIQEDLGKAAYISNVLAMTAGADRKFETPVKLIHEAQYPGCYDISWPMDSSDNSFFYGGPGGPGCA